MILAQLPILVKLVSLLLNKWGLFGIAVIYLFLKGSRRPPAPQNPPPDKAAMFFAFCFFIFLVYLHQTTPEELALEPEQTEIVTPDSLSPGSKRLINVSPKDTKVTPLRSPKHPNDVTPKSAPLPPSRQSIEEFQTRRPFRHPNLRPPQTALPTPTSGQDSLSPTPPSVDRYFSIQVASFESWENAKQAADQYLVELGEATVIHPLNDHTYKILLGQFPTEIEARQYAERHGLLPMLWPRPGAE